MTLTANKPRLTKFTYEKPVDQEKPRGTLPARSEFLGMGIKERVTMDAGCECDTPAAADQL
jgi:hypothetical protein